MSQELAARLASYAYELDYADLDAATVRTVKERVIDSLACAYAAVDEMPVQNVLHYASTKTEEPSASLLCDERTASAEHAALANGTLIGISIGTTPTSQRNPLILPTISVLSSRLQTRTTALEKRRSVRSHSAMKSSVGCAMVLPSGRTGSTTSTTGWSRSRSRSVRSWGYQQPR